MTFITFSAHMAIHFAKKEHLRHKVPDIVTWTDKEMENLHSWIVDQGDLQAFINHYDTENWRISLSAAGMGLGIDLCFISIGLIAFERLFLSLAML